MFSMNTKIANIFTSIASYIEGIGGGKDAWRANSYKKAAKLISELPEDICSVVDPALLPGIGNSLASKIEEIISTGTCQKYEEIKNELPPDTIKELERIPGVGPKTAVQIWKDHGVKSLKELKAKLDDGSIVDAKLTARVEFALREMQRIPIAWALPRVKPILEAVRVLPEVQKASFAGSIRRLKSTIKDVDIIAQVNSFNVTAAMLLLKLKSNFPSDTIELAPDGENKVHFIIKDGDLEVQVDILVASEDFTSKLLYFTGCKEFNIALRKRAKKLGYKLNEYGLFNEDNQFITSNDSERVILEGLGLPYIPPELREPWIANLIDENNIAKVRDIIESFENVPTREDITGDLHIHTSFEDGGSDGSLSIEQLAIQACQLGYKFIGISDHSAGLVIAHGLGNARLLEQIEKIKKLNAKYKVKIYASTELEIRSDGSTPDLKDDVLQQLDYVVLAVHSTGGDHTNKLITALQKMKDLNIKVIIAHPSGRLFGKRAVAEANYDEIFKLASEMNAIIEINAQPDRLDATEELCKLATKYNLKFAINSDTHSELGGLHYGLMLARRACLTKDQIVNTYNLPF